MASPFAANVTARYKVFNRRPIPDEALNARGGDDLDEIAFLYGKLIEDADAREIPHDEFYYLSDEVLDFFVAYQGFGEFRDLVRENSLSRLRAVTRSGGRHQSPQSYLQYVLERIADHPINRIEELIPWNVMDKLNQPDQVMKALAA